MATAVEPGKQAGAPKYEAFVEKQLTRARARIRLLDMTAAALGLLVAVLAYALGMALLDSWFDLSLGMRQAAVVAFIVGVLVYLGVALIRPLSRQVNPYYAARQVEQTLPEAKNSVVNWLDLRAEKLPPAIRSAVGHRAAQDLSQADLETAISGRRVAWLGGTAGMLFLVAVILLCVFRFSPFRSLLGRALVPFGNAAIAHRTGITIIRPAGGDATVPVNQSVPITVQVDGVVPEPNKPDALKLLFRYSQNDPAYEELRLERGDTAREWVARVPEFQVHNGFWYKVTGGDAETAEHRIQIRSAPLLTSFEVTYHFRPYVRRPDFPTADPNLQGLRGTAVTLV
ncbi:MAG TPA: hypothetical protein VKI65_02760, partial [Gemmataceae bacterium]|nr:hypothetical protein [Gemmataceae bacterium]